MGRSMGTMALMSLLLLLSMSAPQYGPYTHGYFVDEVRGTVSDVSGPYVFNHTVRPYSLNVIEFNCSRGSEIYVRIWDLGGDLIYWDAEDTRSYLVVNDSTTVDRGGSSSDGIYWRRLPGYSLTFDSDVPGKIVIEVSGNGNFTFTDHWRTLEEWERGQTTTTEEYAFSPFALFLGISVLGAIGVFLLAIGAGALLLWRASSGKKE